jgi:hypothetical protein
MNRTSRGFEIGQDRRQVAGLVQHRAGGGAEVDPQLAGDDLGQGGLAQAGRAEQQHVVQRLAPALGGLDEDPEIALGLLLADELGQGLRAQGLVGGHGPSAARGGFVRETRRVIGPAPAGRP